MSHIDLGSGPRPLPPHEPKSPKSGGVLGVFREFIASLSGLFGLSPSKERTQIERKFKEIEEGTVTATKVTELATLLRSRPRDISPLRADQMRFAALQKLFASGDYGAIVSQFADCSNPSEREIWCRAYDQVKKTNEGLALKYFLLRYASSSYVPGQDSFERLVENRDAKSEASRILANHLRGKAGFEVPHNTLSSGTHPITIYRTWLGVLQKMMEPDRKIDPAILEGCRIFSREENPYCAAARMLFEEGARALGRSKNPQISIIRRTLGTLDEEMISQVEALTRTTNGPSSYYFGLVARLLRAGREKLSP